MILGTRWLRGTVVVFLLLFVPMPALCIGERTTDQRDFWPRSVPREALALLNRCQDYFYSGEYEAALTCLDSYINLYPDEPVGYWRKLNALYLKIRTERAESGAKDQPKVRDEVEYAKIMTISDLGIEKVEIKLKEARFKKDENAVSFYTYVKEAIVGFKALFQFANGFFLAAEENAKIMLELGEKSNYPDAAALPGLMEYKLSRRGLIERIIARFRGFPTDRKHGLKLIAQTLQDNSTYFSDDVRFIALGILIENDLKSEDIEKIEKILGITTQNLFIYLHSRYPRNKGISVYKKESFDQKRG